MLETFLEQAQIATGTPPEGAEALQRWLTAAIDEAQQAWPGLKVDDFPAVLGARFGAQQGDAEAWFARLVAPDLYLATAIVQGCPGAAARFEASLGGVLRRVARRFAGPRHPEEDLVQGMLEVLVVGSRGRGPRLASYAGQGLLRSWLRVTSVRLAIDATRSGIQHRREDPRDELSVADVAHDPELDFLKCTYRAHFRASFADAVAQLQPEERTLLKLAYLHGLNVDAIGRVFHVHRATAARRVARARASLLEHTRAGLTRSLSVPDDELDSIMGLIHSKLEVSLERLLRTTLS